MHQPQTINPIPPNTVVDAWRRDYKKMQEEMIYAESPEFDDMIGDLESLLKIFNEIEWTVELYFQSAGNASSEPD